MSQNDWAAIWTSDSNFLLAHKKNFGPAISGTGGGEGYDENLK
jgi:hypothetical protein